MNEILGGSIKNFVHPGATVLDLLSLEQWLLARALEHDKPTLLFQMACDYLKQQKIVRIGTERLARMVSTARYQALEATYQILQPLLTKECCLFLDGLLEVDETLESTRLRWLQRTPTANNLGQILATLDKIAFLKRQDIADWDLSRLNPNRAKFLAKIGARATNQYLHEPLVMQALDLVRELHTGSRRKLPIDAPTDFVPDAWRSYIFKVVEQLKKENYSIEDEELKYIWPTRFEHINVYGRYQFNIDEIKKNGKLRKLRQPTLF